MIDVKYSGKLKWCNSCQIVPDLNILSIYYLTASLMPHTCKARERERDQSTSVLYTAFDTHCYFVHCT